MKEKKKIHLFIVFMVSVSLLVIGALPSIVFADIKGGYERITSVTVIEKEAGMTMEKYQESKGETGVSEKTEQSAISQGGIKAFLSKYQVRTGLLPGMNFAVGDLGGLLKVGFIGNIFGDMAVPISFLNSRGLFFRSGLSIGYAPFGSAVSEYEAKINLLPMLVYADLSYPLQIGIKPSLRLGMGGTFSSLKDNSGSPGASDESSFDGTLYIGAGASYQHKAIPRVEFLLNLGYMILFEQVNGNFINLTLGAGYQLY